MWKTAILIMSLTLAALFHAVPSAHAESDKILLVRIQGTALMAPQGRNRWKPAQKWMEIPKGARLRTLSHSSIDILIDRGAIIRVDGDSELVISDMLKRLEKALAKASPGKCKNRPCRNGIVIKLLKGRALFYVSPRLSRLPLLVDTPIGIAGVVGTRFAVDLTSKDRLIVAVLNGHVLVWARGIPEKPVVVGSRLLTVVHMHRPPTPPQKMNRRELKKYDKCLKLNLGLDNSHAMREISSRYKGVFTRGYSPDVVSPAPYQGTLNTGSTAPAETTTSMGTTGATSTTMSTTTMGTGSTSTMTDHTTSMGTTTDRTSMTDHSTGMTDRTSTMTDHSSSMIDRSTSMTDRTTISTPTALSGTDRTTVDRTVTMTPSTRDSSVTTKTSVSKH